MALQMILGGSGAGKSEYLFNEIIRQSCDNPQTQYIVVVPEQYTMASQRKLVESHPNKGILNIDVVSFERLAFKVFEEIGGQDRQVLDDTGKNLILRRVLQLNAGKLKTFGKSIDKIGFVEELKSVISELLQYDISPEKLNEILAETSDNRLLEEKLKDVIIVYSEFKKFLSSNYITSEEILDVLCKVVEKSEKIKKSVLAFDGFTGFTPVQYRLLNLLLINSKGVKITATIDAREQINVYEGMQNLFFMTKEMYRKLMTICDESHIDILNPVVLDSEVNPRFISADKGKTFEDLSFLEKNIFRYNYDKEKLRFSENIKIVSSGSSKEELQFCISEILMLTREQGYRYKDIAIISGDMETYGNLAGNLCSQNDIPCFVDHKKAVIDNPFVVFVRSALEVIEKNYNYDSIFRYLRTGFTDVSREDVDLLENYCIATGIRSRKQWENVWTKKGRGQNAYPLDYLNELREKIVTPLICLEDELKNSDADVKDYVLALYKFIVVSDCSRKIDQLANQPDVGNEYNQLYKKTIELLDKVIELLGSEKLTVREFNRIIESGFSEIKVGLIPPASDCVLIGDIERTRLDNVKVLFFVGVNEGVVPKYSSSRGVFSENDREYLEGMNVKLSAGTREKTFVQKYYLYLIMTKASEKLYISYATKNQDGKSILPSYVIKNVNSLFSGISFRKSDDYKNQFALLRIPKSSINFADEDYIKNVGEKIAADLYNNALFGSVSSFEMYASCQFAYFLRYGLNISKRDEYKFENVDFGNIMHSVLELISKKLSYSKISLSSLSEEERKKLVSETINELSETYKDTVLRDSGRNSYIIKKLELLADRTLFTIGKQLEMGLFYPDEYEKEFITDYDMLQLDNSKGQMAMRGKIDRIDIALDDENVYIRVVDYKTGKRDFDLNEVYSEIKLQLVTYLMAAMDYEAKKYKDKNVVPAGMLYYNIDNPVIEDDGAVTDIDEEILSSLRMNGVVNSRRDVVERMDTTGEKNSKVVPISFNSNAQLAAKSRTMSTEQFKILSEFIQKKTREIGTDILKGKNDVNPYRNDGNSSCKYCQYHEICGFSPELSGKQYRRFFRYDDESIWTKIKNELNENKDSREVE